MPGRTINQVAMIVMLAMGVGIIISCARGPAAVTPEEFYRGKTVTWIVSTDPGSGSDLLGRVVAPYLAEQLGATVKVENMKSEEGDNYVYAEPKKDGLTLLINSTAAVISNDILKAPGVLFEIEKFSFVADVNPARKMLQISPKFPTKTLDGLRQAKALKGAGTTAKGSLALSAAVMLDILGLDGKVITGYQGKKELTLAVGRGEVDFIVTSDNTAKKDEADGFVVNLLAVTEDRSAAVPNVPTMFELGVKTPKELDSVYQYMAYSGTGVATSPGVPEERVEYLRRVFLKLGDNKNLQNDVEKVTGVWSPFLSGKQLQDQMIAIKANKELAGQLDSIFAKYKAVQ
ncbi:MAG: hypothetical protein HYY30_11090 [Chloroflexi bacterium]|nr:hypothetical protein [Chloroflexota bacterium]